MIKPMLYAASAALSVLSVGASAVMADQVTATSSFYAFTANAANAARAAVGNQLQVTASAHSTTATTVDFTFRNFIGVASNVAEIYFASGSAISTFSILSQSGASYVADQSGSRTNPGEVPSANAIGFQTSVISGTGNNATRASVDARRGNTGLNESADTLTIRIAFTGKTMADVISALNSPTSSSWLRIAMHVRSIDGNNSDSFVNGAPPNALMVPLPAAAWPALATIGGVMGLGIYRRRAARS